MGYGGYGYGGAPYGSKPRGNAPAEAASAAATAYDATVAVEQPNAAPEAATATATANDATVTTDYPGQAQAQPATAVAQALDAAVTASSNVAAEAATATATANDATSSTSGTNVLAGIASATATANDVVPDVGAETYVYPAAATATGYAFPANPNEAASTPAENGTAYSAVVAEDPTLVGGFPVDWTWRSITDTTDWEWRVLVDGVDVTTVNGHRTMPAAPILVAEPYGETSISLVLNGVTRYLLADSLYGWVRPGAPVRINKHDKDTGAYLGNLGSFVVYDITTAGGRAGGEVVLLCAGALAGPAGVTHYKPALSGASADVGAVIADALDFPSKQHTFTSDTVGVTWTDPDSEFGAAAATALNRVDRLLVDAYTSGRWTVARTTAAADYELVLKDTTTVDATITLGVPGVNEDVRQNLAESPNVIYGTYDTTDVAADSALRTAPLAYDEKCDPYLYNSSTGAVTGANPNYDPSKPRVERFINVGTAVSRATAVALAERLIFDPDDLPWYGTIEVAVGVPTGDYGGSGDPAGVMGPLDFREGMNVRVRGLPGNPLLHVAGVELDLERWTARLTVDEAARDWTEIQAILGKDKDPASTAGARTDPTYTYSSSFAGYTPSTYYYGGGYGGGYVGDGAYYGAPPPFIESATAPERPAGWGWLKPDGA